MDGTVNHMKKMKNNEMKISTKKTTTQDQVTLNIFSFLLGPFGLLVDFYVLLFLLKLIQSFLTRKPAKFLTVFLNQQ